MTEHKQVNVGDIVHIQGTDRLYSATLDGFAHYREPSKSESLPVGTVVQYTGNAIPSVKPLIAVKHYHAGWRFAVSNSGDPKKSVWWVDSGEYVELTPNASKSIDPYVYKDRDGDTWEKQRNGTYNLSAADVEKHNIDLTNPRSRGDFTGKTLAYIEAEYGSYED